MVEISKDLIEMISSTIESIKYALVGKELGLNGCIEFEVAVVKSGSTKGGFRFIIADASGKYSKESISKIKFKVSGKSFPDGRKINDVWDIK